MDAPSFNWADEAEPQRLEMDALNELLTLDGTQNHNDTVGTLVIGASCTCRDFFSRV